MDVDWDLYAVVRGCAAVTAVSATNTTSDCEISFQQDRNFPASANSCFRDLFEAPSLADQELHELYKPFVFQSSDFSQITISPQNLPISSPLSVLGGLRDLTSGQQQQIVKQLPRQTQKIQTFCFDNGRKNIVSHNLSTRSKKRKNHLKRICHVAAENVSSDVWSWRKYGQKPIKGSPYPRGYYRCSTSKGCVARKQVERHRSDPGMFIVTYTAEHNHPMPTHRNSLAGTTRQKQAETPKPDDSIVNPCSMETSPVASLSAAPEKMEGSRREGFFEFEDDDDDFSGSKMELEDDFFSGLDDFATSDSVDYISDHFPESVEFPWVSNGATSIAGGG